MAETGPGFPSVVSSGLRFGVVWDLGGGPVRKHVPSCRFRLPCVVRNPKTVNPNVLTAPKSNSQAGCVVQQRWAS